MVVSSNLSILCSLIFLISLDYTGCLEIASEKCFVPEVMHAEMLSKASNTSEHGEIITFVCDAGYHFNNGTSNKTTKLETTCHFGEWIEPIPEECQAEKCFVPEVMHAEMLSKASNTSEHGEIITFVCDAGYHFNNGTSNKTTKLETTCHFGEWIEPIPEECQAGCTLSSDPRYTYTDSAGSEKENGSIISNGTSLTVTCKMSYTYYYSYYYTNTPSDDTITCVGEVLTHPNLNCPEVTPDPCLELEHGSVKRGNGYYLVSCDKGYSLDLIVPEKSDCTCENGKLISVYGKQEPSCKPDKCMVPFEFDERLSVKTRRRVSLSGGSIVDVEDFVYFNCSKTSQLIYEPLNRRFKCFNGLWIEAERDPNWKLGNNGDFPTCREAVCTPNCTNGGVCFKDDNCRCKHLTEGKLCEKFICDNTCQENGGNCSGPGKCSCPEDRFGLNCKDKGCNISKDASAYNGQEKIFKPGETVEDFFCDQQKGLILPSQHEMTCDNGTWSNIVKCIKGCVPPTNAANHNGKDLFRPGETLSNMWCDHGYFLSSQDGMKCRNGGSWSENVTCEKGCTLPNDAAKHRRQKDIFGPGETVDNLFCNDGNVLSSQNGMICQNGGSWSEIVKCEKAVSYHVSVKTFNHTPQVPVTNAYIILHGLNRTTRKLDLSGNFSKLTLVETIVKAKDVRPIISVEVEHSSQSYWYLEFVSIYIETFEEYDVVKPDKPVLVNGDKSVVLPRSGNQGNCVIKFEAGRKWYPKWRKIWESKHLHCISKQKSERHCKQACITQNIVSCQYVHYNHVYGDCFCLGVSEKEYFTDKRHQWDSHIYMPVCKYM